MQNQARPCSDFLPRISPSSIGLFSIGLKFWHNKLVFSSPNFFQIHFLDFGLSMVVFRVKAMVKYSDACSDFLPSFLRTWDGLFSIWLKFLFKKIVFSSPNFLGGRIFHFGIWILPKTTVRVHLLTVSNHTVKLRPASEKVPKWRMSVKTLSSTVV